MNKTISVEQNLELLAGLAAGLLATPVVTITMYNRDNDAAGGTVGSGSFSCVCADHVEHLVISCDSDWAKAHPDVDFKQLGSPRSAMTQPFGLYASMPFRNDDGVIIGSVACAGDEARDLSDRELAVLKHVTGLAAAAIAAAPDSGVETGVDNASAAKVVNFSA